MSELQVIQKVLERVARRRRWQGGWQGFWLGLFFGALVWCLALALYKLFPLPVTVLPGAGAVAALLMLVGFGLGWWQAPSLEATARWVDGTQQLQERLSTALEVVTATTDTSWQTLLVRDAAKHASSLEPRRLLPYHLPGLTRWTLLALLLGAGLGFVPERRSQNYLQKQQDAAIIREMGHELTTLTRRNLTNHPPVLDTTRKALETVNELGDRLQKASLTRSDALKDVTSVTEKLKQEARELAKNPGLRRLEQAARTPSGESAPSGASLQKQIENLQKSLGSKSANAQALDRLKQELEKAQQAAAGLPANDSTEGAAARQQLKQSLSSLSQQAKSLGLDLPGLDAAIAALNAADNDLILRDLKASLTDLDKLRSLAKALQQMQAQVEKMGKDLAEQLEKGQVEMAEATMRKMIDQLQTANLSPEQLQKILDEVSKAVDPAGQYGKVAEYLKQAVGQMQKGQKPAAAQALAEAAKELNKLAQDAGDLNAMLAALEALKVAELSIGNGR
ncbi:MAG: hypothetical protein KGS61_04640 [Verrucomicrobia bacterium]|nr:hypothetical protein [Verrucomicrobiota bacterium]